MDNEYSLGLDFGSSEVSGFSYFFYSSWCIKYLTHCITSQCTNTQKTHRTNAANMTELSTCPLHTPHISHHPICTVTLFLSSTFHQVKTLSLPLSSESYKSLCFKQSTISFSLSFWVLSSEILFVTTKGWKSNPNSMAKSLVVSYGCNKVPHSLQHRTLYPNNCHSLPPLKPTLSLTLQNQNQKPLSLKYNSLTTLINRRVSSPITAALDSDVPHPLHQVFPQSQLSVLCIMIVINKLVLVSLC